MDVFFIRLTFGFCTVWLPAPLESRTNEKVALAGSFGGTQPLILELRYAPNGSPLIETATVRLLTSGEVASQNLPHLLNSASEKR